MSAFSIIMSFYFDGYREIQVMEKEVKMQIYFEGGREVTHRLR